ncbi:TylF/MycF/NovP-related O-methyltransferase [Salinarimonas soli]|uniref:Class I SAM-dependent methyltransferase n=1 Tax=Salinarimonas soli TaxID=1638099 RepID=A0A5B2V742_9HYPH|nr:TylF/MycF/NovP-related O-methyltransferase [Salinarimonas soli]KAA2234781.1 hypothetical protein F0L46_22800 [Salinarimonas soli]
MSQTNPPDFLAIKERCAGMLEPEVYKMIYETARSSGPGDLVEIGTARGAATVALALGIGASANPDRNVVTFDLLDPLNYLEDAERHVASGADLSERFIAQIRANIDAFGVTERVHLNFGDVADTYPRADVRAPLAGVMVDADGALDRDFALLYNDLAPGAVVIIDDCDDAAHLWRWTNGEIRVDLKHKLTASFIRYFTKLGLLEPTAVIRNTYFGRKPLAATQSVDFSRLDIIGVYREIVFSNVDRSLVPVGPVHGARTAAVKVLKSRFPALYRTLRNALQR